MTRRRMDQWGIRFQVIRYESGYVWTSEATEQLIWTDLYSAISTKSGFGVARRAFNEFLQLSRDLMATVDPEERKELIRVFANKYGPLRGYNTCSTLSEWCQEAMEFLDLYDVSRAIRSGRFVEFNKRVLGPSERRPKIEYAGKYVPRLTIADANVVSHVQMAPDTTPETIRLGDIATNARPRGRVVATMLLARHVNRKLNGGLNFRVAQTDTAQFWTEPAALIHLLYLRLWMYTVDREGLERQTTCMCCGKEIKGRRSKKFCNDQCRWEYNNRRRALENKLTATEVG